MSEFLAITDADFVRDPNLKDSECCWLINEASNYTFNITVKRNLNFYKKYFLNAAIKHVMALKKVSSF